MTDEVHRAPKRMRLRYAGVCRICHTQLPAGQTAIYLPDARQVECLECATRAEPTSPPVDQSGPEAGAAGASARREFERRVAKREQRVRTAHPKLGGLILALSDEPQSTRAWQRGAIGEQKLAERLDRLTDGRAMVLHDRRIRGTRANIDHIVVSAAGVFVIDAKRYTGRPRLRIQGGLLRPRAESLVVGSRDQTKLVSGVRKQIDLVKAALASQAGQVRVRGILCFIEADWPLIGGSFSIQGVDVLWPKKLQEEILAPGPLDDQWVADVHRILATTFPSA